MTGDDGRFMRRALTLARRAWGRTSPNPMVGAVAVRDGRIVGEGFHPQVGLPHAEIYALRAAGKNARGATLYVTLEPCSTAGRTPPCTEAIIRAGVSRVTVAVVDPNPRHAGRGLEILRAAGIAAESGLLAAEAAELNKAFFHRMQTGKPYVLLKMAMTLDGKIATASGESKWITGVAARRRVQKLRQWCDAIMVGAETARLDRPGLIVRSPADWPCQPEKWIFGRMREKELHELFPADPGVSQCAPQNPAEWEAFLRGLGSRGINALLLEGGGELAGRALQAGAVDEVEFHIAPRLLTGRNSRPVTGGADPEFLAQAWHLENWNIRRAGEDLIVSGRIAGRRETCLPD